MSVLVVDYGSISDLNSVATRLAEKFQNKVGNFEHIVNGLNSLSTSRSNLVNANYFIKKKNEQYKSKISKINLFNTKMSQFSEKAKETDKRVASRITSETKEFKKVNNINVSTLAVIGNSIENAFWSKTPLTAGIKNWIDNKVRETKYDIKDWYRNGGKYVINIVKIVAVAVLIAAITILTLGTGAAAIFGILSLSLLAINTGSEVYYNVKAAQNGSNRIEAEKLSKKSGFEMVSAGGNALDETFNTNCFEKGLSGLFLGATVVDFAYGSYKLGSAFKTEFKNIRLAKNYAKNNGVYSGVKHFLKKSYTSVNSGFTRNNTTQILKPIQKIFNNKTQNYFKVRKVVNRVLKPYRYYHQVVKNYAILPKYEKGKKIAKRLQDELMGGYNKPSLAY